MARPSGATAHSLLEHARDRFAPELQIPDGDGTELDHIRAWSILRAQLHLSNSQLAERIAEHAGVAVAHDVDSASSELVQGLPRRVARRLCVLPLREDGDRVHVATANPFPLGLADDLQFALGREVVLEVAPPDVLEVAISGAYDGRHASGVGPDTLDLDEVGPGGADDPAHAGHVPRVARMLLVRAIEERASDLHVQPFLHGAVVRLRVDGVLRRIAFLPDVVASSVVRFFKAQSGMDPTDRTIPQDGRLAVALGSRDFDLRISTLPISGGHEKLVIRILGKKREFDLRQLGMSLDEIHRLRRLAAQPSGVVLFCGPTGSGKTTTLYSILSELNSEEVSIATVENPVEYQLPGLSQTEVHEKAGMTFAAALRSVLRQDPDIILVGEIRDAETATTAVQAALTGHLVFSTLHTRSSFAAVPRLLDLGTESTVLAESLAGVVSQRLFRHLCPACAVPCEAPLHPDEELFRVLTGARQARRAVGCQACEFSGYAGRFVVTEILEVGPALAEAISRGTVGEGDLRRVAADSFRSLASGASRHIISGDTTAAEVSRVVGRAFWMDLAKAYDAPPPDLNELFGRVDSDSEHRTALLLTGATDAFDDAFRRRLGESWFTPHVAGSPEAARRILEEHDEIELVVLDLDPDASDATLLDDVAAYRRELAWSRLPAVVRTPPGRDELEARIREAGATSRFLPQDAGVDALVALVNEALSSDSDYQWGRQDSQAEAEGDPAG